MSLPNTKKDYTAISIKDSSVLYPPSACFATSVIVNWYYLMRKRKNGIVTVVRMLKVEYDKTWPINRGPKIMSNMVHKPLAQLSKWVHILCVITFLKSS